MSAVAEAAFTLLVQRHGPMVLNVCQGVLGDRHDAEDVFQATFLVLARQAGSIRREDAVASWLYGVARRLSLRSRRMICAPARTRAKTSGRAGIGRTRHGTADGDLAGAVRRAGSAAGAVPLRGGTLRSRGQFVRPCR